MVTVSQTSKTLAYLILKNLNQHGDDKDDDGSNDNDDDHDSRINFDGETHPLTKN